MTLERLERKCNVHVEREDLRIPYRETITAAAAAEGKHKKQSGGHGQFGVCHLRLEPLPRGSGFEFKDEVVGGAIPRQYIPAVEKGVLETFAGGGLYGYPVVDVAVTVDDGKAHSVDSNEVSFKMAAALAIRTAMAEAGPVVLEPISRLEVTIPDECQGDVLGDLSSRRARIVGTDAADVEGYQKVTATAPTAELTRYAVDLRALTGGRGSFSVVYDHYDPVPEHLMASIPKVDGGANSDRLGRAQNGCVWSKFTGRWARISVPMSSLPGVLTATTASEPVDRPKGLDDVGRARSGRCRRPGTPPAWPGSSSLSLA